MTSGAKCMTFLKALYDTVHKHININLTYSAFTFLVDIYLMMIEKS